MKSSRKPEVRTRQDRQSTNNRGVSEEAIEQRASASRSPRPATTSEQSGYQSRKQMEATERATLAPFAQKSGDARGRKYPEPRHAYRTEFDPDRPRLHLSRPLLQWDYQTQ